MEVIIAATGHRPTKLGGYSDAALERLISIAMEYLKKERPDEAISGMALGWDTAWALAALKLGIPLVAALPHDGQSEIWPEKARKRWHYIVNLAKKVETVAPGPYAIWKMQTRNIWMVNHSDRLCAMWNGSDGGTSNCVAYAKQVKCPIDNLWGEFVVMAQRATTEEKGK